MKTFCETSFGMGLPDEILCLIEHNCGELHYRKTKSCFLYEKSYFGLHDARVPTTYLEKNELINSVPFRFDFKKPVHIKLLLLLDSQYGRYSGYFLEEFYNPVLGCIDNTKTVKRNVFMFNKSYDMLNDENMFDLLTETKTKNNKKRKFVH